MKGEESKALQSQLTQNILKDPEATREAKLMALMGERQLALFENILELRQDQLKLRQEHLHLRQEQLDLRRLHTEEKNKHSTLVTRVDELEARVERIDGKCLQCPKLARSENDQGECCGNEGPQDPGSKRGTGEGPG